MAANPKAQKTLILLIDAPLSAGEAGATTFDEADQQSLNALLTGAGKPAVEACSLKGSAVTLSFASPAEATAAFAFLCAQPMVPLPGARHAKALSHVGVGSPLTLKVALKPCAAEPLAPNALAGVVAVAGPPSIEIKSSHCFQPTSFVANFESFHEAACALDAWRATPPTLPGGWEFLNAAHKQGTHQWAPGAGAAMAGASSGASSGASGGASSGVSGAAMGGGAEPPPHPLPHPQPHPTHTASLFVTLGAPEPAWAGTPAEEKAALAAAVNAELKGRCEATCAFVTGNGPGFFFNFTGATLALATADSLAAFAALEAAAGERRGLLGRRIDKLDLGRGPQGGGALLQLSLRLSGPLPPPPALITLDTAINVALAQQKCPARCSKVKGTGPVYFAPFPGKAAASEALAALQACKAAGLQLCQRSIVEVAFNEEGRGSDSEGGVGGKGSDSEGGVGGKVGKEPQGSSGKDPHGGKGGKDRAEKPPPPPGLPHWPMDLARCTGG